MLQAINDKAKGILGWVIILLISIPFALWGIQEYLGNGPQPFAVKVNDTEISVAQYEEALSRHKQRLESMFGGSLPTGEEFDKSVKRQVVDQLVSRAVIENVAREAGFRIANETLAKNIQGMESFQSEGKFMSSNYKQVVNSQGMSVSEFEYLYRKDLMVQQLQNGIVKSSIVDVASLELISRIQRQTRDVDYLRFKQSAYVSEIDISDEQAQAYYTENKQRYMTPEQVSIAYVELKGEDLKVDVDVDEEALRRQYDEYVAGLAQNDERKARHILVQLPEGADAATKTSKKKIIEDALKKIQSGESFEAVAKAISEDPGSASKGGDLGWVNRGMMVPAFDDALFKMAKGEVSAVVQSSFGYHIIRLDDVKATAIASFESKREELIKDLKRNEIDNVFYERSEIMATTAYENDQSLQPVTEALGLTIKTTPLFTQFAGQGIAQHEAVRKAAFNAAVVKEGRNSDVIDLGNNHIVVLRMDEHKASTARSFDDVKPQVLTTLKAIQAKEKAQASALQALSDLEQGKSMASIAKDSHVELKKLGVIKRDHTGVDPQLLASAFKMKRPAAKAEFKTVELVDGVALIALNAVHESTEAAKPEDMQALAKELESGLSNQEILAVLDYLKSQSDIVTAKNLF
ncbi:MAG: SurA N-terminal domain-containing protein [Gammaproteobacteria bacterium]|nr:SurA N-terminal domain-containing protein [Gammaproteobacteria bacterium]